MKSLWDDAAAATYAGDLGLRVYASRLLGRDPSLVLHGGGNTSVKTSEPNVYGEDEPILRIKASGWDLATIEARGFSPCRLGPLQKLATLDALSDLRMAAELRACMTDPGASSPSVEAILHAVLPAKFVDHTHADAFLSITNSPSGEERIRSLYGPKVVVVPYAMPGFVLARLFAEIYPREATDETIGVALLNHGLISFGTTARESYERMIALVTLAEDYLAGRNAWNVQRPVAEPPASNLRVDLATFRRDLSVLTGAPCVVKTHRDAACLDFIQRDDLAALALRGPATPDHVIRTKRLPVLGRDLSAYRSQYEAYFDSESARKDPRPVPNDPAPRIVLDRDWGMLAAGRTARDAAIAAELYRHTMEIVLRAHELGGWRPLPPSDIFDVEYWDLEQAKVRSTGARPPFLGEVALVSGAASGIGLACVEALLARGAAVVGLDRDPAVVQRHQRPDYLGLVCDLTSEDQIRGALEQAVREFGGLDLLVLNAGIFPEGRRIGELETDLWRRVMSVNLDATFFLMRECHPLLRLAPAGGRVVVIGSKNVPAPGPAAAAYSASKAAVNQLMRVAALEWAADRIRINALHPNMVFDTALWTPEVLASRARHYGLSVEDYRKNNLLRVEVTSRDVAELAAELLGPRFAKTTGAQIPVDGGNERVL